jgi:segregation and condensation protein B
MNNKALLEAALFVSDKPLSLDRLSAVLGIGSKEEAKKLIEELQKDYFDFDSGIELLETPQGYELRVKPEYRENVAKLAPFADLSDGLMRTLAIVAAKQPVKQSLIVKYQGNKSYNYINQLEEKGLVKTEKYQRTKLVSTTPGFEKYFGTSSDDIKKMLETKAKEVKE